MSSSEPSARHDPHDEPQRVEALSLLALGEQIDAEFDVHARVCADCQAELASLRRTVALGRRIGERHGDVLLAPSPAVWRGISAELGFPADAERPAGNRSAPTAQHRPWWHWAVGAAASIVIVAAGVAGGYLVGRDSGPVGTQVAATAQLQQMPDGPIGVQGSAVVHETTDGTQVSVQTAGLPLRDGYYEVWLYDPAADKMVAIGTLPQNGAASFPVPPGLNVHAYHVVDVSAQNYDGDPSHQQSVLRGTLTQ